jgi:hypothetical protein
VVDAQCIGVEFSIQVSLFSISYRHLIFMKLTTGCYSERLITTVVSFVKCMLS